MIIKIVIIEPQTVIRMALNFVISKFKNIEVVESHPSVEDYIKCRGDACDIVFLGYYNFNTDVALLKAELPLKTKVLIYTEPLTDFSFIKLFREGLDGYVLKSSDISTLRSTLFKIHAGRKLFPDTPKTLIAKAKKVPKTYFSISPAHMQFLQLCASDIHYSEIAERLGKSARTIEGYRDLYFKKFKVTTRIGIVISALKNGLIKI